MWFSLPSNVILLHTELQSLQWPHLGATIFEFVVLLGNDVSVPGSW